MRTEPEINTNRHQLQQQNTHNLNAIFDSQHETPSIHFSPISIAEPTDSGRFFHFGSFDIGPPLVKSDSVSTDQDDATGIADEARYNLATRVMSNGVEVIIAGDKNAKGTLKPNALRVLPGLSRKPMTLAPSTLKDQMILVMPSNAQENYTIPINSNHFITKTCLTTYTYRTTYLQDGKTTVESREKVVSNTATEERNYLKISPTESLGVTLSRTPELAVGVFYTTYTYYNTILDDDLPLVASSEHVLTNTITGPDDYISFLQPSEEATPVLETNTYFSRISLTKTLKESDVEKIVSTSNILTQVIVTESLPPRSTAVMTSYMAFDLDETSAQSQPTESTSTRIGMLPSSSSKTSFQTYTYFNAEKSEDNSSQTKSNLNISQNSPQEMYLYMKKDGLKTASKVSDIDKTSHLAPTTSLSVDLNLKEDHQNDLHIYATKTYHTTFTYFTTLMNSQGNGASSTVVSFHTRVIENVITETIPSFVIDSNLLSKIETKLLNPINHNSYVTMVTLAGGQSLEITAMNMLHPSLVATNTNTQNIAGLKENISSKLEHTTSISSSSVPSITPPPSVNSNEILDSDVASSEIESLVADQHATTESEVTYQNNTKTAGTTDFPSVNQLIGSLNLNRLQALGPVFNAMAGLIQNNFATSHANDLKKNLSLINVESKHSTKNISAYDNVPTHNGPIYIPVQNLKGENKYENVEDMKFAGYVSPQSLHIYPPETNWFLDENKSVKKPEIGPGKPTYETPLLNGGIPISPGEVITANSDVIVGKQNGIQPRVPFKSKSPAENALLSPPPTTSTLPYKFQYPQSPKQTMNNPSLIPLEASHEKQAYNFDGILKPPPLKPPLQGLQQGIRKHNPHHTFSPNYRINYATSHMHQPHQIHLQQIHQPIPIKHPPQQGLQMQQHQQPQRPNMQRPLPNNSGFSNLNKSKPVPQKPNYIPYTPHDYDQSHSTNDKKNEFEYSQQIHNNEILEIKRIPEVYSADLPGTTLASNRGNNSLGGGAYKTLIKKVINSDKPMLVDVQPSQITNIVIPRDNAASILIVESTVEMHKNGQYYDEPTMYPDTVVTGTIAHGAHARKPIISNQQVNLDTSVLSHNIDINVPPITFKKDAEFPHSTPVRGQINKNEPSNFYMPHVTIPITDNQIQVNLTPQSMITRKIPGPILNDRNALNRSESDDGIRPQNLGRIRHPPAYQKPTYYVPEMQMGPIYPNRPLKHPDAMEYNYQFGKIHMPTSAAKVPQFVDLPKKTIPFLNVIPLNKTSDVPQLPYNPRPTVQTRPNPEDNLQIFTNASINTQHVTTFNPLPLLNLFYGVQNDDEEDLSGDFSQGLQSNPVENYWVKNGHHQSDDDGDIDSTEGSNKIEDQKVSSSLNIEIPTQNQPTKHETAAIRKTNFTNSLEQQKTMAESNDNPMLSLRTRTTKRTTTTKRPSAAISANKLSFKTSLIGTESFLDPESVNAVNNMGELPTSSASPLNPNAIRNTPSFGRPFTQSKPITKPTNLPKNEQMIVINSGEGFKLQHDEKIATTEREQQLISINTKTIDDPQKDTKSQTEAPFNPKYTIKTRKTSSMTLSTTSSTPSLTKSSANFNLNKMEVMASPKPNTSQHNTHLKQSADIFDLHESMNPHNHEFIHVASDEITALQENVHKSGLMTQRPGSTNLYPVLSEPSVNMQPPPISNVPQTESVMGLSPPPPPAVPSLSTFTPSVSPPDKAYQTINVTNANHYPLMPSVDTTQPPFKLHSRPTKITTSSRYTPSTSRPKIKVPSTTHSSPVSRRMPLLPVSKLTTPAAKTSDFPTNTPSIVKKENALIPERAKDVPEISRTRNATKTSTQSTGKNGGYIIPMFSLNQKIPDNILVDGSEEDAERLQSTVKVLENQTTATTITLQSAIKTEMPSTRQSRPQTPLNHINTRTRIISRIIIPTKYVTNTQILTVTTTKTSVQTSLGIPSTQTLTLTKTKTFTLVDTVTETQTLLQPTRIIESHAATATHVIHASPPIEVIKSTIEVVSPEATNEEPNIPNETTAHTTKNPKVTSTTTSDSPQGLENNSIFVVMTDKKSRDGVFSISPSMIETPQNINAIGSSTGGAMNENSIELDYDDNITFDLPARDEEAEANEVNHVLLGGVLIATPPKVSENSNIGTTLSSCRPSCKASRNEVCHHVETRSLCVCRPGFARMFPDRPCRPTYTYAMQIPIHRVSKEVLHFKEQYRIRDSEDFKQLAGITHDAVDRMVMQSDLRDVYHGVHVTSFDATNTDNGILGKFLIQLSDNSDEKRLVDVFRKYLRLNNFSLGGTDIFTTKAGVNTLEIVDFNECAHNQFHDCSENSKCFNLQGTYTCSCQEGYADLSENSIYPGRICSAEMIGCEKCHYHGKCVQTGENMQPVCECFHWYTGASCQLNLKILLIALIAIGTILFILLLFCVLVTCTRRRKNRNMQSLMSGIHIIAPRNSRLSSKSLTADKRAMIKDTSSEASQNSLPYALKKDPGKQSALSKKSKPNQHAPTMQQVPYRNINQRGHPSSTLMSSMSEMDHRHNFTEQNDRSLTVMIPRAKYHNSTTQPASHTETVNSATYNNEADLKSSPTENLSKASMFYYNPEKIQNAPSKASATNANHGALHTTSTGALVSAGFEVSATVGSVVSQHLKAQNPSSALTQSYESRGSQMPKLIDELHSRKSNHQDIHTQYNTYKEGEKFIDSMDVWLDTIQQNELANEARSFDETTIQAPTKSLRSVYERQMSQSNGNDEANTMAERDVGSTFLLPHTHLYKPDRDSDVSGFDSF